MRDLSGTITAGGSWQEISTNTKRKWFEFHNLSDADMFIFQSYNSAASPPSPYAGSFRIPPGGLYEPARTDVAGGVLRVFCSTTGKAFTCREIY
jgi:hypothetical protein